MAKENTENQVVNDGDLSKLLISYREKIGFSSVQMADALCLPENTILKLESEDFETLAEPPYIRGYLRNYAKIADTNPDKLIKNYEALRGADPSELDYHFKSKTTILNKPQRNISPIFTQLFFLVLLVAVLAGLSMIPGINKWITETWESFSEQTNTEGGLSLDNPLLTGSMPVPTPLPFSERLSAQSSENTGDTSATTDNSTETPPEESSTNTSEAETNTSEATTNTAASTTNNETQEQEVASDDTATEEETITDSNLIKIKLVFNKEVWMRIRDKDNKTLFEATNKAGNEKLLELEKPLTFRVGNAQGLSLFVNDKVVDISGYIKGAVANFTLD